MPRSVVAHALRGASVRPSQPARLSTRSCAPQHVVAPTSSSSGTHGLTGADQLLIGSTTLGLLQRAAVPILAVPSLGASSAADIVQTGRVVGSWRLSTSTRRRPETSTWLHASRDGSGRRCRWAPSSAQSRHPRGSKGMSARMIESRSDALKRSSRRWRRLDDGSFRRTHVSCAVRPRTTSPRSSSLNEFHS